MAPFAGETLGEPAPAASDLGDPFAAAQVESGDNRIEFLVLRRLEHRRPVGIERRRIGHPAIEPLGIEPVAEIVMGENVPAAAAPRIAVDRMTEAVCEPRHRKSGDRLAQGFVIRREKLDQRRKIRARPVAGHEGLAEADIAGEHETSDGPPPVQNEHGVGSVMRAAVADRETVRPDDGQTPMMELPKEQFQHLRAPVGRAVAMEKFVRSISHDRTPRSFVCSKETVSRGALARGTIRIPFSQSRSASQ